MLPPIFSDLEIVFGPVPPRLEAVIAEGVLWQVSRDRFLLTIPGIGGFLAEHGRTLTIQPEAGVADEDIWRFARMTPLAAIAMQRRLATFRASAIVLGHGKAVLIAGASGVGKSTLAEALRRHGARVIADDLAIVTMDRPDGPYVATMMHADRPDGVPLGAFVSLKPHDAATLASRRLSGIEAFSALRFLGYNSLVAQAIMDARTQFQMMGNLAASVPIHSVARPSERATPEDLAQWVRDRFS